MRLLTLIAGCGRAIASMALWPDPVVAHLGGMIVGVAITALWVFRERWPDAR